jgi:hypothetical protein
MAQLVLGPVLRYVDETEATVWVETDGPCEVEILGCKAPTFRVAGHHYALVHVAGLEPGSTNQYDVRLDGEQAWPLPGSPFPPSVVRTPSADRPARIVFGSCRVAAPHEPPHSLRKDTHPDGREVDALHALALRMCEQPVQEWPDRLLMIGDQVYADEVSPGTRDFIAERRDIHRPPYEDVADFEEYTQLYRESWGEPVMRWLLSTLASAMLFDDHDVHDDWNISESWVEDMRRLHWWEDRITGAFMSYWIYQHIGNLEPGHLHDDEVYGQVMGAEDGTEALRAFAQRADREAAGARWSWCRDYGGVRVLAIDSRAGRVLSNGRRSMVDEGEWDWICERLVGGHNHLVIATTLPLLLGQGMHYFEAWNEAVCAGAWGEGAARAGEWIRRALDLEHWAAFGESFERVVQRLGEVAAGQHGEPPASIVILSGDVHHAYLSQVGFRRDVGAQTPVWQAVCSPFRNPLDDRERRMIRFGVSRPAHALGRALAKTAGVPDPSIRWRMVDGPFFDNQVATLELHDRSARPTVERTPRTGELSLQTCFTRPLS